VAKPPEDQQHERETCCCLLPKSSRNTQPRCVVRPGPSTLENHRCIYPPREQPQTQCETTHERHRAGEQTSSVQKRFRGLRRDGTVTGAVSRLASSGLEASGGSTMHSFPASGARDGPAAKRLQGCFWNAEADSEAKNNRKGQHSACFGALQARGQHYDASAAKRNRDRYSNRDGNHSRREHGVIRSVACSPVL
jgi:hypothetical protein